MTNPTLHVALELAKSGVPVLPVNTSTKKIPWSNEDAGVDRGRGGVHLATTDEARIEELFERGDGVAVPMGDASGMVTIDIDLYKTETGVMDWYKAHKKILTRTGRCHETQNGGLHFVFSAIPAFRYPGKLHPAVELKASGGYVLWPPSGGYRVISEGSMALLTETMLEELGVDVEKGVGAGAYVTMSDDEVVELIRIGADFHDAFRTLAARYAGRGSTAGEINAALTAIGWQAMSTVPPERRERLEEALGEELTRAIESAIDKFGRTPPDQLTEEEIADVERMAAKHGITFEASDELDEEEETPPEKTKWTILNPRVLRHTVYDAPDFVSDGVIELIKGEVTALIGTSGVGKSFVLGNVAFAVSCDRGDIIGCKIERPGNVLFIANEDNEDAIANRFKAGVLHHKLSDRSKYNVVTRLLGEYLNTDPLVLTKKEFGIVSRLKDAVEDLILDAKEHEAEVIILDPFSTVFVGDENSASDVGEIMATLNYIARMTNAAVLFAVHIPKSAGRKPDWYRGEKESARGSGALMGQCQAMTTVSVWKPDGAGTSVPYTPGVVVLDHAKRKNGKEIGGVLWRLEGYDVTVNHPATGEERVRDYGLMFPIDEAAAISLHDKAQGERSRAAYHAVPPDKVSAVADAIKEASDEDGCIRQVELVDIIARARAVDASTIRGERFQAGVTTVMIDDDHKLVKTDRKIRSSAVWCLSW